MKIKGDSVKVAGLRPEALLAMIIADQVYTRHGMAFVLTSVTDGKHSIKSLHYSGNAFDCRIYDGTDNEALVKEIKGKLNIDFDVILEKDHIHIEFDPKWR
jgi:hypothetical protein